MRTLTETIVAQRPNLRSADHDAEILERLIVKDVGVRATSQKLLFGCIAIALVAVAALGVIRWTVAAGALFFVYVCHEILLWLAHLATSTDRASALQRVYLRTVIAQLDATVNAAAGDGMTESGIIGHVESIAQDLGSIASRFSPMEEADSQ